MEPSSAGKEDSVISDRSASKRVESDKSKSKEKEKTRKKSRSAKPDTSESRGHKSRSGDISSSESTNTKNIGNSDYIQDRASKALSESTQGLSKIGRPKDDGSGVQWMAASAVRNLSDHMENIKKHPIVVVSTDKTTGTSYMLARGTSPMTGETVFGFSSSGIDADCISVSEKQLHTIASWEYLLSPDAEAEHEFIWLPSGDTLAPTVSIGKNSETGNDISIARFKKTGRYFPAIVDGSGRVLFIEGSDVRELPGSLPYQTLRRASKKKQLAAGDDERVVMISSSRSFAEASRSASTGGSVTNAESKFFATGPVRWELDKRGVRWALIKDDSDIIQAAKHLPCVGLSFDPASKQPIFAFRSVSATSSEPIFGVCHIEGGTKLECSYSSAKGVGVTHRRLLLAPEQSNDSEFVWVSPNLKGGGEAPSLLVNIGDGDPRMKLGFARVKRGSAWLPGLYKNGTVTYFEQGGLQEGNNSAIYELLCYVRKGSELSSTAGANPAMMSARKPLLSIALHAEAQGQQIGHNSIDSIFFAHAENTARSRKKAKEKSDDQQPWPSDSAGCRWIAIPELSDQITIEKLKELYSQYPCLLITGDDSETGSSTFAARFETEDFVVAVGYASETKPYCVDLSSKKRRVLEALVWTVLMAPDPASNKEYLWVSSLDKKFDLAKRHMVNIGSDATIARAHTDAGMTPLLWSAGGVYVRHKRRFEPLKELEEFYLLCHVEKSARPPFKKFVAARYSSDPLQEIFCPSSQKPKEVSKIPSSLPVIGSWFSSDSGCRWVNPPYVGVPSVTETSVKEFFASFPCVIVGYDQEGANLYACRFLSADGSSPVFGFSSDFDGFGVSQAMTTQKSALRRILLAPDPTDDFEYVWASPAGKSGAEASRHLVPIADVNATVTIGFARFRSGRYILPGVVMDQKMMYFSKGGLKTVVGSNYDMLCRVKKGSVLSTSSPGLTPAMKANRQVKFSCDPLVTLPNSPASAELSSGAAFDEDGNALLDYSASSSMDEWLRHQEGNMQSGEEDSDDEEFQNQMIAKRRDEIKEGIRNKLQENREKEILKAINQQESELTRDADGMVWANIKDASSMNELGKKYPFINGGFDEKGRRTYICRFPIPGREKEKIIGSASDKIATAILFEENKLITSASWEVLLASDKFKFGWLASNKPAEAARIPSDGINFGTSINPIYIATTVTLGNTYLGVFAGRQCLYASKDGKTSVSNTIPEPRLPEVAPVALPEGDLAVDIRQLPDLAANFVLKQDLIDLWNATTPQTKHFFLGRDTKHSSYKVIIRVDTIGLSIVRYNKAGGKTLQELKEYHERKLYARIKDWKRVAKISVAINVLRVIQVSSSGRYVCRTYTVPNPSELEKSVAAMRPSLRSDVDESDYRPGSCPVCGKTNWKSGTSTGAVLFGGAMFGLVGALAAAAATSKTRCRSCGYQAQNSSLNESDVASALLAGRFASSASSAMFDFLADVSF